MDKKWDAKRRGDDDILSAVLYEQKRASTSAVETADNGEGADNADGGMQVLLRMTNWTLAS